MSINRREQSLLAITGIVVLFGILGFSIRKQLDAFNEKRDRLQALDLLRKEERTLLSMEQALRAKYEEVRDLMPIFAAKDQVDTFWMNRMDTLAEEEGVKILRRQVGKETLVGDVYEFSIECREWEGTLESFARFLFALQNEGAMLDVRDLSIRLHPQQKDVLRGSFTLYCAYMREGEKK